MKPRLVVLVPAHNEEDQIADTLQSLSAQTMQPHRIVVIADHCTDRTVEIARSFPVVVMETRDNAHRKSGALIQGWRAWCQDADYVFTMDADTVLADDFFELSVDLMESNTDLGGACACPMLKPMPETSAWGALLWRLGRLDFGGYMRILCRWKFSPEVLFGYGTIFRADALRSVASKDLNSDPWDVNSIVEDYKISIQLRQLGYRLSIIPGALAYTDAPLTIRELWVQRMRWAGGTWQELVHAGWHPYTRKVWLTVLGCLGAACLRILAMIAWAVILILGVHVTWTWWWTIPILIAVADRIDMTRYTMNADWKDVVLAASVLPMEVMSILREAWTIWSGWVVVRRRKLAW